VREIENTFLVRGYCGGGI